MVSEPEIHDINRHPSAENEIAPRWSREDVQRVLYHVVRAYEQAHSYAFIEHKDGTKHQRKTPKRFIFFGQRLPFLGGDSELLRDAIRIARETVIDNDWWPLTDRKESL